MDAKTKENRINNLSSFMKGCKILRIKLEKSNPMLVSKEIKDKRICKSFKIWDKK